MGCCCRDYDIFMGIKMFLYLVVIVMLSEDCDVVGVSSVFCIMHKLASG
jgi:hypothetical protein